MINKLRRLWGYRPPSPYRKLKMGGIAEYSIIIDEHEREWFEMRGWIEAPGFFGWGYRPKEGQTVMISRPLTLSGIIPESLIGQKITGCSMHAGQGITLDKQPIENKVLVYSPLSAWHYILFDNREIKCDPTHYNERRPWVSNWADEDTPRWDDLSSFIIGAEIINIDVMPKKLTLTLTKNNEEHLMEFVQNDPRLCKLHNGKDLPDAFEAGEISEYILFKHPHARFWT